MSSIQDFTTWEPLLRFLRAGNADSLATPRSHVAGQVGHYGWSLPSPPRHRSRDRALQDEAMQRVQDALTEDGLEEISFVAQMSATGRTVLHLLSSGPAVESGLGPYPGSLILVEGAVPEPWRRLPAPAPGAAPAPSADPALLERMLRERLGDGIAATDAEITDAEARLGVALPDELKVLYRVTRGRREDFEGDRAAARRVADAVGCELVPPEKLHIADAASRPCPWEFAAMEAVVTPPDAAVQGLVGSPGWIAFGVGGGGEPIAIDLTPGPRGHKGQIIMIDHELDIGADLVADSLTDLVTGRHRDSGSAGQGAEPPTVAYVNSRDLASVEAAAHPELEVLSIGAWEDDPLSLAPVAGLPRLRTLSAQPGTLADPLEITKLTGLEFLELGPEEWRVLLDAEAVPRNLSAAAITVRGNPHPIPIVTTANEILARWNRPPIPQTTIEGDLGPLE